MINIKKTINDIWLSIEPIVELFIYIGLAFAISKLVNITSIQAITVVFIYWMMNMIKEIALITVRRT